MHEYSHLLDVQSGLIMGAIGIAVALFLTWLEKI